jgi:hypothetical protein
MCPSRDRVVAKTTPPAPRATRDDVPATATAQVLEDNPGANRVVGAPSTAAGPDTVHA